MRLETEQGHFVADVQPVIPHAAGLLPDTVVLWGARVFVKTSSGYVVRPGEVWRETLPMVVHDHRGVVVSVDGLEELGHIAYDAHRVVAGVDTMPEWLQLEPAQREAWRAAADAVSMLLHLQRPDNPAHPRR